MIDALIDAHFGEDGGVPSGRESSVYDEDLEQRTGGLCFTESVLTELRLGCVNW